MALQERPVTGLECVFYYSTGTHAVPVWVAITRAIDVSFSLSKGEAEQSSRLSLWKFSKGTLMDLEITFGYRKKNGADTVLDALMTNAIAGTPTEFAMMDDIITEVGAEGIRAYCEIMSLGNTQGLEAAEEMEFTLKPTFIEESGSLVEPDWYTIS